MMIYLALLRFLRNPCTVEFPDFPGLTGTMPNPAQARTHASGVLLRHAQELRSDAAPCRHRRRQARSWGGRNGDAVPMLVRVPPIES